MYPVRREYWTEPNSAAYRKLTPAGNARTWLVWVLAVLLLISAGIIYEALASRFKLIAGSPVKLPRPLSDFPTDIGQWVGEDLPIPTTTRQYMETNFADDFLSRRYMNGTTKAWADVYIVYCSSRPGGILGHQPRVCYPAHGWVHDNTEPSEFTSRNGQQIPCLIHRFHKPDTYEQTVILNFYILNGRITTTEKEFSGILGRKINIAGDPARYVAQVQISSLLENSIRKAAEQMTDLVLAFLPDENGRVRAVEWGNTASGPRKQTETAPTEAGTL